MSVPISPTNTPLAQERFGPGKANAVALRQDADRVSSLKALDEFVGLSSREPSAMNASLASLAHTWSIGLILFLNPPKNILD